MSQVNVKNTNLFIKKQNSDDCSCYEHTLKKNLKIINTYKGFDPITIHISYKCFPNGSWRTLEGVRVHVMGYVVM